MSCHVHPGWPSSACPHVHNANAAISHFAAGAIERARVSGDQDAPQFLRALAIALP